MATPKARTLQQRFGFQDKDLTTPQHDEIMMWLNKSAEKILYSPPWQSWLKKRWDKRIEEQETFIKVNGGENIYQQIMQHVPKSQDTIAIENITCQWEYPIVDQNNRSKSQYVIGFVDLRVSFEVKMPSASYSSDGHSINNWKWGTATRNISINFEVKTKIPSLGELFRQINLYKTYDDSYFVIVSPDDRFQHQIISQGLYFLKYEPKKYE